MRAGRCALDDQAAGRNVGPSGSSRTPARNRSKGYCFESTRCAPGATPTRTFSAMGWKSARKCQVLLSARKIGSASWRERVGKYVWIWVVGVALKKKKK